MIQRGFIKKSSKFAKFFVAVLDDGTVRAVQQDVIIDIFYDFGFLGINLEFVIAEIIDAVLRLSPRLDNFYEKIGVKPLGLLYPIVCRLQVPK